MISIKIHRETKVESFMVSNDMKNIKSGTSK